MKNKKFRQALCEINARRFVEKISALLPVRRSRNKAQYASRSRAIRQRWYIGCVMRYQREYCSDARLNGVFVAEAKTDPSFLVPERVVNENPLVFGCLAWNVLSGAYEHVK